MPRCEVCGNEQVRWFIQIGNKENQVFYYCEDCMDFDLLEPICEATHLEIGEYYEGE